MRYRVVIEGRNYKMCLENEPALFGFYTTRFIEACDHESAVEIAINMIEDDLAPKMLNDANDPPVNRVDGVVEMESFPSGRAPGGGYSWYIDKGEDS